MRALFFSMIVMYALLAGAQKTYTPRSLTGASGGKDAWPALQAQLKSAHNNISVLPTDAAKANKALQQLQQPLSEPLAAMVFHSGGILFDHGWIRLLGSGSAQLKRNLPDWNKGKTQGSPAKGGYLLIGEDVLGGFFAINYGKLGKDKGIIYYLNPDDLHWQSMQMNLTEFIDFCCNADLNQFYQSLRWSSWQQDIKNLGTNEVFSFFPLLWDKGNTSIEQCFRNTKPVEEYYEFVMSSRVKLRIK